MRKEAMPEKNEGVKYIEETELKEQIAESILKELPEWFGLPDSTREYIEKSKNLPFFAYYMAGNYVGFIVLKETSKYTAEIYVMGVLKEYHRHGIGRKLFQVFLQYAEQKQYEFVQVKTVEEGHYEEYDRTRLFYEQLGFRKLECFPTLWDEGNPCLIMVMPVKNRKQKSSLSKEVQLMEVDETNLKAVLALEVREEQKRFVPSPEGILARAWVYRKENAVVYAIAVEKQAVGLIMIYDLEEEPSCYCLMEMMVDKRYQNCGYGQQALEKLIVKYSEKPKFPRIELAVDRENTAAIHAYEKVGFTDSEYVDPELPQYRNLVYCFEHH